MQLSKEDEASAGEENEVRREDQEKINRFSRLHQRELVLEELLKGKQVLPPLLLSAHSSATSWMIGRECLQICMMEE